MKKRNILLLVIIGLLFFGMFSRVTAKPKVLSYARIGIIFATGGLGDKSFNDAAYRGMIMAEEKYGDNVSIHYVEPQTVPEFATYQDQYAATGLYDLIICVGFLQTTALNETIDTYPNQKFVLIDDIVDKPNIRSITFKEHEGSFLVGAMAGMVTKTGKLGFLGGLDIYLINKFLAGFEQGAHHINNSIKITAVYSPDPTNPWADIPGGKVVGKTLFGQGNDIVYAAAGGTGIGVIQAANETEDVYAIGVDSDQDYLAKGKVLCSMLKLVETAVFVSIDDIIQQKWTDGNYSYGIKEDGVGISDMTYTQDIKNGNFELNGVTKTRGEHIADIKDKIVAGTIKVSDTPGEVATLETTTKTKTQTEETSEIPAPGFGLFLAIVVMAFTTVKIRKRKKS